MTANEVFGPCFGPVSGPCFGPLQALASLNPPKPTSQTGQPDTPDRPARPTSQNSRQGRPAGSGSGQASRQRGRTRARDQGQGARAGTRAGTQGSTPPHHLHPPPPTPGYPPPHRTLCRARTTAGHVHARAQKPNGESATRRPRIRVVSYGTPGNGPFCHIRVLKLLKPRGLLRVRKTRVQSEPN